MTKEAREERERIVEYIRRRAALSVGPFAIADEIAEGAHEPQDSDEPTQAPRDTTEGATEK